MREEESLFGFNEINKNYHMPGEGNIRGFVNQKEKGADAVVGIRFTTSAIMDGSSEIMVFGTAVKLG